MEIPEGKLNKKQKQQREKGKVQGSRTNIVRRLEIILITV